MVTERVPDIRTRKFEWTRAKILTAAWELARRDGLGALSLRELAATVGMRAASLYHYFPSKNALFDAMYEQGIQASAARIRESPPGRDAKETLRNIVRTFVDNAMSDPVRYELLFHRPVPGFEPSPEHLAIGLASLDRVRQAAAAAGVRSDRDFDLFMAATRGLVTLQIANEPAGDRWVRLVDDAVEMLVLYATTGRRKGGRR
jgi:AcrR family transcriptional regulator